MLKCKAACLLVVLLGVGMAAGDDIFPAPWRGMDGTTFQLWEFGTSQNPVPPDVSSNQYGTPEVTVEGQFPSTVWLPSWGGREGVWRVGLDMEVFVPNRPDPNFWKEIWLQVTYNAGTAGYGPLVLTNPQYESSEVVQTLDLGNGWYHETRRIIIPFNPPEELIYLLPPFCELYVDQVVVDTWCVPEPGTMAMILLGGGLMLRRRGRR